MLLFGCNGSAHTLTATDPKSILPSKSAPLGSKGEGGKERGAKRMYCHFVVMVLSPQIATSPTSILSDDHQVNQSSESAPEDLTDSS